jgi:hypothetical protein
MHTSDAYSVLVKELETIRQWPAKELIALVGGPAVARTVDLAGEVVELEVLVRWSDSARTSVRITGHARGPSTWHHEHLQESITASVTSESCNGA